MTSLLRGAVPVLVAALLVGVAGCSGAGRQEVVVEPTSGSVTLEVGEVLVVDLGTINASVGDSWTLVVEPDPAVLAVGPVDADYQGEEGETGAPTALTHRFEAVGPGETTLELQFSYRGSLDDADTLDRVSEPRIRLQVTVD